MLKHFVTEDVKISSSKVFSYKSFSDLKTLTYGNKLFETYIRDVFGYKLNSARGEGIVSRESFSRILIYFYVRTVRGESQIQKSRFVCLISANESYFSSGKLKYLKLYSDS